MFVECSLARARHALQKTQQAQHNCDTGESAAALGECSLRGEPEYPTHGLRPTNFNDGGLLTGSALPQDVGDSDKANQKTGTNSDASRLTGDDGFVNLTLDLSQLALDVRTVQLTAHDAASARSRSMRACLRRSERRFSAVIA